MKMSDRPRLMSLEIGRGVAALLVCLYHYTGYNEKYLGDAGHTLVFSGGNAGVEYFFVLSGFIIYWVHRADIGIKGRISIFLTKRFIRIYPIFWVIVAPVGLMILLIPSLGAEKNLTIGRYIVDLLLIPREGDLVLPPAWTLHRELFFYALFSIFVMKPRFGGLLLVTWQLLVIINVIAPFTPDNHKALINVPFGPRNLGFGFGLISAYLLDKYRFDAVLSRGLMVLGLTGFGVLLASEGYYMLVHGIKTSHLENAYIWEQGYLLCAFFSIFGLVSIELRKPLNIPKLLEIFGSSSYVLYIIHLPAGSIIYKILNSSYLRGLLHPEVAFWMAVIFTVTVAIIFHLIIEKPLLRFCRKIIFKGKNNDKGASQHGFKASDLV